MNCNLSVYIGAEYGRNRTLFNHNAPGTRQGDRRPGEQARHLADPYSVQLLPAEIEDSVIDGFSEKWKVDGPALVEKLKAMDLRYLMALADAAERYWELVVRGEEINPRYALRLRP